MKTILLALCCAVTCITSAQTVYLADTAFVTDIGYGGAPASCRAPHTQYFGWQMGRAQGTSLADVFTVPSGETWTFDTVIVYGYQHNSGTTSTFLNCNLQIYDGTPGLGGLVTWGDTSTNVLVSSGFTGIYRVDTSASNGGLVSRSRPIMYLKLYLSPAASLSAGTYWLSWSAAGSLSVIPDAPDKVLPGRINPSGQMGRQLYGGSWYYTTDSGNNIGFNKIIKARAGLVSVPSGVHTAVTQLKNYPNPCSDETTIEFTLQQASLVKLEVYNVLGELVSKPVDAGMNIGMHRVEFSTSDLPSGTYFYRLSSAAGVVCRQMEVQR